MREAMFREGIITEKDLPVGDGTVRDLGSTTRLNLIFDTVTRQAHGYAEWRQSMEEPLLSAYPARRFVRLPGALTERARHDEAEEKVRLKTDFHWWAFFQNAADIGGFEVPWEPFGFNSYMTTENVKRREAEKLKLVKKGEKLYRPQQVEEYNAGIRASTEQMSPSMLQRLLMDLDAGAEVTESFAKMKVESVLTRPRVSEAIAIQTSVKEKRYSIEEALAAIDQVHSCLETFYSEGGAEIPMGITNRTRIIATSTSLS
jgi:hypothetical protein